MDYDFDTKITDLRGVPMKVSDDSEEVATMGFIIANALLNPDPNIRSNFAMRLLLAQRVAAGGQGPLKTEERKQVIDSGAVAYGQTRPLLAGLIEQFIERTGIYADKKEAPNAS